MLRIAFFFYGTMMVLALLFSWCYVGWKSWWGWRSSWWLEVMLGILGGFGVVWGSRVGMMRLASGRRLVEEFVLALGKGTRVQMVLLACLSGVSEEALFRAVLLPSWGWFWSGLCFGLLHVGSRVYFLWWTLFACVFGWGMGLWCTFFPGLGFPVAFHITVNALNLLWLRNRFRERLKAQERL
ncbi:MAG: CPBP family glutamic-type intramembrane protease [Myxococcota bacterium]